MENIEKVKQLIQEYRQLQPLTLAYQKKLDKKFRLEFNYNSNHIEGNTITYKGTELLLFYDRIPQENLTLQEVEEIKGHDLVLFDLQKMIEEKEILTEKKIKEWHKMLLVRPFYKEATTPQGWKTQRLIDVGDYKKEPNSVRLKNGEMFEFASVQDTPILMGEWIQWFRKEEEKNELEPVFLAAQLHYKFVRIHPFDDGNGRLSRILMNYVLLKNNLPFVVIKSADKKNYLAALEQADLGNMAAFEDYIAKQMIWSLELCIKAAKGKNIEEDTDFEKEMVLLEKQFKAHNKTEILKSKEAILNIFDDSIVRLIEEFRIKGQLFEKYYVQNKFDLDCSIIKTGSPNIFGSITNISKLFEGSERRFFNLNQKIQTVADITKEMQDVRAEIAVDIDFLTIKYEFEFCNQHNIKPFNYTMHLKVKFENGRYFVVSDDQKLLEKKYSEQLTNSEIQEIVKIIANKHKNFLEEKLKNNEQ